MMGAKPLTMEELTSLRKITESAKGKSVGYWLDESAINEFKCAANPATVLRLPAAAERSCRRPIADSPRDGTLIDIFSKEGVRFANVKYDAPWWRYLNENGHWCKMKTFEPETWLPIPGEGGV